MSKNFNNIRTLKIQLKIGYLKKEPKEFAFMKRYPPMDRRYKLPITTIDPAKIPYLSLYKQIKAKNPLLEDERLYPVYWEQEPQALTMAKKQYELIKFHGLSHDEAYKMAQKYVNNIESVAYEELKVFNKSLDKQGSSTASFFSNEKIVEFVNHWRSIMRATPYKDLDLSDQGEIDFFIQTEILQWKEVERERRMKDPVFVMQFDKLRDLIFPEISTSRKSEFQAERTTEESKDAFADIMGVNRMRLRTSFPFYMEDYIKYFEKVKAQPNLSIWTIKERDRFSRWIVDTLGIHEVLDDHTFSHRDKPVISPTKYLDSVRAHFFPMIQYPDKAATLELPNIQKMRSILYSNDVGYKTIDDKLFIKRFYLLPSLLFPEETLTTTLLKDEDKLRSAIRNEGYLQSEMKKAGLQEAPVSKLKEKLEHYSQLFPKAQKMPPYGPSYGADFSALDALLDDGDSSYGKGLNSFGSLSSEGRQEPSEKQWKAWVVLNETFDQMKSFAGVRLFQLSTSGESDKEARLKNFTAYLDGQQAACKPSKRFYLDPETELIFFTKFVDDVGTLFEILKDISKMRSPSSAENTASEAIATRIAALLVQNIADVSEKASISQAFHEVTRGAKPSQMDTIEDIVAFASQDSFLLTKITHLLTLGKAIRPSDILRGAAASTATRASSADNKKESILGDKLTLIKKIAVTRACSEFKREMTPTELEFVSVVVERGSEIVIDIDPSAPNPKMDKVFDLMYKFVGENLTNDLGRQLSYVERRLLSIALGRLTRSRFDLDISDAGAAANVESESLAEDESGNAPLKHLLTDTERLQLLEKYEFNVSTGLEIDREEYLRAMVQRDPAQAENEADMYLINQERIDTQIITRARFNRLYERKEAARRAKEIMSTKRLRVGKARTLQIT